MNAQYALIRPLRLPEPAAPIQFTAYHPKDVRPETWYTLLAYATSLEALAAVQSDSRPVWVPQVTPAQAGARQPRQSSVELRW